MLKKQKIALKYLSPLFAVFIAAFISLAVYNHYILDSSLANLTIALNMVETKHKVGSEKEIADILNDTFIMELSRGGFDLALAVKLELSAQMLEGLSKEELQKYRRELSRLTTASNIEFAASIANNISRETQIKDIKHFIQQAIIIKKKMANKPAFLSTIDDMAIKLFPQPRKVDINVIKGDITKIEDSLPQYQGENLQEKYLEIAKLSLLIKDFKYCQTNLDKSLQVSQKNQPGLKTQFFLGILFRLKGEFKEAAATFGNVKDSLPKDWRIFAAYAEADCVYKSGDIKRAAVLFKKLFEDEQFSQVAQLSQFRAAYIYLYDLEDILQAKDAFSKLGRNKDEILSDIRSYVEKKIDADMARQCVEQGFILIEEGYTSSLEQRYIGSLEKFDLALSILPNYATAHIGKAVAFCFLNKEVQAVEEGEQAKANAPRDAEVLANLGFIYYNLDMLDQAIKEYEAAVKIQPHIAVLRYNLGTLYLLKAKYPEARENLYRAIAYDREYAKAYNNLGYTLWILGEYTKAKEDFIIATALKPDFIEGRYNLGAVYFALGKYEAAREEFIKVEKLKPQFRKVQYYLSEIKKKLGY